MRFKMSFVIAGLFATTAIGQVSTGPGGTVYKPSQLPQVAEVPDITGDGISDLLVGYPYVNNGEGVVYIFEGPVSTANGYLPLPESAFGVLQPVPGVFNFGSKISLMTYQDGVTRPTVLIVASREIDGVVSDTAVHVDIQPLFNYVLSGGFVQHVSSSHFSGLVSAGLLPFDLSYVPGVLGAASSGSEEGSGLIPPTGGTEQWEEESPGYHDILDGAGYDTPGNWLDFELASYNAIKVSKMAANGYGWTPGQHNAFRHALWMAGLTEKFGSEVAEALGDHHEESSEDEEDTAVDQYNNEVARQIMEQCLAEGESLSECMYKMIDMIHDEDGTFITDQNDPRVQQIIDGTLKIEDIEV